jgi:rare lipoprotein A
MVTGLCAVHMEYSQLRPNPVDPSHRGNHNKRETGNRGIRVKIKPKWQDEYDGIRPQGGGRFRAFQSLGSEYCRDAGKRDCGIGHIPERRGCASRAKSLLQGAANGGWKNLSVRRLSGYAAQEFLKEFLNRSPASRSPNYLSKSARPPLHKAISLPLPFLLFFLFLGCVLLNGCGHKPTQAQVPPPPSLPQNPPTATPPPETTTTEDEKINIPADAKPIFEETGMASWYGAPYHNRRGSNGEIYNMHAMTAAHLTLPLGSVARITNLKTGSSAVVRITDRGPFVPGRIIDLSLAAAKAVDVYLPGTARVRLEVLQSPLPLDTGGRWAVQIGSFTGQKAAEELVEHLQRRYQTAKVIKFVSPVGAWWVRVRVTDDDRQRATALAHETETAEGSVFLVRLD